VDIQERGEDLRDQLAQDPAFADDFRRKFDLTWLHHENALEGVVYSFHELDAALRGVTVAEASVMNGYRDIVNHAAALELIRVEAQTKKPKVSFALVKRLQETLALGLPPSKAGLELRKEMPLHRTYFHEIAQPGKIQGLLDKLFETVDGADFKSLNPVQKSARFQFEFMRIFPFTENSGRLARLVGNLYLLAGGYDLCVIHAVDRQRYHESFRLGEHQLRELIADALDNALQNAEKYVRQALAERRRVIARRA
jgi:Fic family protein